MLSGSKVLDLERGRWTSEPDIRYIPYFKAENANGRHILIQPLKDIACFYMLVDDINWSFILKHHIHSNGKWKSGRMVVECNGVVKMRKSRLNVFDGDIL
jgi:hypothetical protein